MYSFSNVFLIITRKCYLFILQLYLRKKKLIGEISLVDVRQDRIQPTCVFKSSNFLIKDIKTLLANIDLPYSDW